MIVVFGSVNLDLVARVARLPRPGETITGEDHVFIYLDTFNDKRRAFFFAVNALGVQADGVRTEGSGAAGKMFGTNIDYSPDFLFESKGQITADGFVVEVEVMGGLLVEGKSLPGPSGQAARTRSTGRGRTDQAMHPRYQ